MRALTAVALGGVASLLLMGSKSRGGYTAHEWGTFTCVQGSDGELLEWSPLESSGLPGFVYDWRRPGLNGRAISPYLSKAAMVTLQRMETPVIYFYSDRERTVDVSVKFPRGLITEWYPQASKIGPSTTPVPAFVARLDGYAHQAGASPNFTFASLAGTSGSSESGASWSNVRIMAPSPENAALVNLPSDPSRSHYFAARETDANYLGLETKTSTNSVLEHEKFIFYRGVGNFETPLRVMLTSERKVVLENFGEEPLTNLFVLNVNGGAGNFIRVGHLLPGNRCEVPLLSTQPRRSLKALSDQLGYSMAEALVEEGLFKREATAMIQTWRDSWFEEEGLRVLYLLPRKWTDRTLPLTFDPAPAQLTRVMVGRAEVIGSELEDRLSANLESAARGDLEARARVESELRMLGRFAEPALQLATRNLTLESRDAAWEIFRAARQPSPGRS